MELRLYIVCVLLCVKIVLCRRCLPFKYVTNGSKCGDNTRVKGSYCGVGRCYLFGTRCKGGCRNVDGLAPFKRGDVIMCTEYGAWKGSLALNGTHVVFPLFDRGFTRVVQDFATAHFHLGHYCRVETSLFDHYAHLLGHTPKNDSFITDVNIFSRNWEFQVTYWKYGVAFMPSELIQFFGVYNEEMVYELQ